MTPSNLYSLSKLLVFLLEQPTDKLFVNFNGNLTPSGHQTRDVDRQLTPSLYTLFLRDVGSHKLPITQNYIPKFYRYQELLKCTPNPNRKYI